MAPARREDINGYAGVTEEVKRGVMGQAVPQEGMGRVVWPVVTGAVARPEATAVMGSPGVMVAGAWLKAIPAAVPARQRLRMAPETVLLAGCFEKESEQPERWRRAGCSSIARQR
jgi:hypothetical protein